MRLDRHLIILLASAAALGACATAPVQTAAAPPPAAVVAAAPDEPAPLSSLVCQVNIPHTEFQLDNGLTVLVHEDHKAPVVAVSVWYNVGSKDEPAAKPASRTCSSI